MDETKAIQAYGAQQNGITRQEVADLARVLVEELLAKRENTIVDSVVVYQEPRKPSSGPLPEQVIHGDANNTIKLFEDGRTPTNYLNSISVGDLVVVSNDVRTSKKGKIRSNSRMFSDDIFYIARVSAITECSFILEIKKEDGRFVEHGSTFSREHGKSSDNFMIVMPYPGSVLCAAARMVFNASTIASERILAYEGKVKDFDHFSILHPWAKEMYPHKEKTALLLEIIQAAERLTALVESLDDGK